LPLPLGGDSYPRDSKSYQQRASCERSDQERRPPSPHTIAPTFVGAAASPNHAASPQKDAPEASKDSRRID